MISTGLLRQTAAKARPTSTALGRRRLARVWPQGSSALWTWKGCRCRPRRAGSPKCHPNVSKRASALCIAGRWVRATLPSAALARRLHWAVLRGWGCFRWWAAWEAQFAVPELVAAPRAPEAVRQLPLALLSSRWLWREAFWEERRRAGCLWPPHGTRFLYAVPLVLSLKTQKRV